VCVRLSVDTLERLNELTDFHKIWYGSNVVGGHFNAAVFSFLQSAVKAWGTCELERQHYTHKAPVAFCDILSASLHLPQSRDRSYYVSRRILAHPPLWLQKHTDPRAHDFVHSSYLWHQPWLANVTCAWTWRLCGIYPAL